MRCDEFVEHLTAFDVGALSGAPAAEARSHLTACAACRMAAAAERQLVREVRMVAERAPDDLHRAVQAALRGAGRPGKARRWRRAFVAVVALSALAVLAAAVTERIADLRPGGSRSATGAAARLPTTIEGAWAAFAAARLPLEGWDELDSRQKDLLASSPAYDLLALRLDLAAEGGIHLAGLAAVASEYRDGGERIVVFRWWNRAGAAGGAAGQATAPRALDTRTTSWGRTRGAVWERGDMVLCAIGSFPASRFEQIVAQLHDATPSGP
ncbi:MAG TPA: zf-HC2 domain-containing protein [Actinomycetes bacterium]|nr:zf-HC2 domain-containing protein [Actinomycetes bacterium]